MKYLCSFLILISATATAQIPYSQKESLIKEFQYGEAQKAQSLFNEVNKGFVFERSEIDKMPILKPEVNTSGILELTSQDKMPNPLFKEEE